LTGFENWNGRASPGTSLDEFARKSTAPPVAQFTEQLALVHASPGDPWRAPATDDDSLAGAYLPLKPPVAVYSHIHRPFVRFLPGVTVANTAAPDFPTTAIRVLLIS